MNNTTKKSMMLISRAANPILLFVAILSFVFIGVFKTWYYQELFSKHFSNWFALVAGIAIATMMGSGRFAFMLSSASDVMSKNKWGYSIGSLGSAAFMIYEIIMAVNMGKHWGGPETSIYIGIFVSVVLLGALIEIRMCLMLLEPASTPAKSQTTTTTTGGNVGAPRAISWNNIFSQNSTSTTP